MIVQVGTSQMELWRIEGDFTNAPHAHDDEFQITVPLRGFCVFTQENKLYSLQGGGSLVQHPRDRHYFEIRDGSSVLIFKIKTARIKEFTGKDHPELALHQQFDPFFLSRKFRGWAVRLINDDEWNRMAQEETEAEVLGVLFSALTGNHHHCLDADLHAPLPLPSRDPLMKKVLEYIHEHYADELAVDTLAAIAAQSRYHFIRSFKAEVGDTPYQYVLRLRVEEAKRLLRQTDLSVTEIGLRLGFSGTSPFHRVFVKAVGVSPDRYRRSIHF